jgi:hypothetical protein
VRAVDKISSLEALLILALHVLCDSPHASASYSEGLPWQMQEATSGP